MEQHIANVAELEKRRSGQSLTLSDQKSKTLDQEDGIRRINKSVSGIRRNVKSSNPTPGILKIFGVGSNAIITVSGAMSAGRMIVEGYNQNKEWSKNAGIIQSDIDKLIALQETLTQTDAVQETSKFTRMSRTMDKNILQCSVEDEVTRISALGIKEFKDTDPAVFELFTSLIPGSRASGMPTAGNTETNT